MRIKPFQAVYPDFDFIASPDSFFGTVKQDYPEYSKNGFFKKTAQEAIYICQIKNKRRSYTGIITCTDILDYIDGKIKKHENTIAAKEQQQMHLLIARTAMVKPILICYPDVEEINTLIKKYIKSNEKFYSTTFETNQETHNFWEVNDGDTIQKLQELFEQKIPESYIADGHHRCAATALLHTRTQDKKNAKACNELLSAYFPSSELEIHDFNRVVEAISNTCSLTHFMARLSLVCDIELMKKPAKPSKKHEMSLYINQEWYKIVWKKSVLKKYKKEKVNLDATLLDEKVLKEIIGIEDIRTDLRIKYIEGPKGIDDIVNRCNKNENRIAFFLYPVQLKDLMTIADDNKIMPPKSTWFEPRMKNGLLVKDI